MTSFYRNVFLISLGFLSFTELSYASGSRESEKTDLIKMEQRSGRVSSSTQSSAMQDKEKRREELRKKLIGMRVKALPKESIQPNDSSPVSVSSFQREDKFWVNGRGERILLESK